MKLSIPTPKDIYKWINDRTGIDSIMDKMLNEPVTGGSKWSYVFGSSLLFVFSIQIITGIFLSTYYSASTTDAWGSVYFIQEQATLGWFVRGMHSIGSSAMVALCGMHLLQVFIFGAYKKPRELNWVTGLVMLFMVLGFGLTGYLLPWDQKGYWATRVATSIMGTSPVIGKYLQVLIQGGSDYGNLTLTRFSTIHKIVLPATLSIFVMIHLYLFRRHGVTPSWKLGKEELKARTEPFWPYQAFKDAVIALLIFVILVSITFWKHGTELQSPADPSSNYIARPEWYFRFLFELLKYFEGELEIIGTIVIPTIGAGFLFLIPFLDLGEARSLSKRRPFAVALFAGLCTICSLTAVSFISDSNNPQIVEQREKSEKEAIKVKKLASKGIPAEGGLAVLLNDPLFAGERLFVEKCTVCHKLEGKGENKSLDVTDYNSREWIFGFLKNPDDPKYYGNTGIKIMQPVDLPDSQIYDIVEFLLAQTGKHFFLDEDAVKRGEYLVAEDEDMQCLYCHSFNGKGQMLAPDLTDYGSDNWLKEFIKDPASLRFYGKQNKMTVFKDKLSEQQIENIVVFLQSLSDRQGIAANHTE